MFLFTSVRGKGRSGEAELAGRVYNQANAMVLIGKTLAESAGQVSEHTQQQVAHTESLAEAMRQMNDSVAEIASRASETAHAATRMSQLNDQCFGEMENLSMTVSDVTRAFDQISAAMTQLRETSAAVAKVVQMISEIATQTKLLSLNASIEAAHAGEQGRGFAVVAQEVRNLAERTRSSAKEIETVIEQNSALTGEVCEAIARGRDTAQQSVEGAKAAVLALSAVATEIETVNSRVQQIAAATEEQSASATNITSGVGEVARFARDTLTEAKTSCQASANVVRIAEKIEARMGEQDLCFFGLAPLEDPVKMNKSFQPLGRLVSRLLGCSLYLRIGHDYEDAVKDLGEGRSLVAYLTPSTYVEAHSRYGVEPLAVPLAKGEPFYRAAIVVRADSGITSLKELRGKRFAFGDPKSTGSKAMPEAMLKNGGVGIHDLSGHGFVGNHDNVANNVLSKNYDGGGLMLSVAEQYVEKGLTILAVSDPIPQFPVCASPKLPGAQRAQLRAALLELKDADILAALGNHVTGFAPIEDRDYDGVRAMLKSLAR